MCNRMSVSSRWQKNRFNQSRSFKLCFIGENSGAVEAARLGFVSRVSPSDSALMDTPLEICRVISKNRPVAVQGTKLSLNYSRDHMVKEGLEHIALHNSAALTSKDVLDSFMAASSGNGSPAEFQPMLPHSKL